MTQLEIKFDKSGEMLRDEGIKTAIEHAEEVDEGWQEKALEFLKWWIKRWNHNFAIEDVRHAAYLFGKVPESPSARAWGGVAREAAKRGWIRKVGYTITTNPKSHCTPATLWESCL